MKSRFGAVMLAAAALVLTVGVGIGLAGGRPTDGSTAAAGIDSSGAIVQLKGDSLATYSKTKPAPGKKIDFSSSTVKSYRAQLSALRNDFKQWLRTNASSAKVTGEFDISLNAVSVQLNGTALSTIASAPMVQKAQYEGLYRTLDSNDPDLNVISAILAWNSAQVGGAPNAGRGAKIGIIDSGIDHTHPCFSDTGFPASPQLGDRRFTNNKVIVAKVFYNKSGVTGLTPEAVQEHGTHVAGTAACDLDTPVTVDGVDVPYDMSGVAPAALLGNYNVFPGDVTNARSEDILNALETAYADGMDVVNMSLGGGPGKSPNQATWLGAQDLLSAAVNALDQANLVVALSAGNDGPAAGTIGSPGLAERAVSAGASTVGHFIGAPFTIGAVTTGVASGDFPTVTSDLTAPIGVVTGPVGGLGTACSALPGGSLAGKIAVLSRGTCTFSTKIRNAQDAGAVATIVVNNVAGDPVAMAEDGTPNQPTIPAYMASLADRSALVASDGATGTIGATQTYIRSANDNIMAGFSSRGPTAVEFRVKPDVVAPGVNVLSSVPHQSCATPPCFAFMQGTSMASPHLAGSAAVVRSAHPTWTAAQVRSAVVNTADEGVLTDFQTGTSVVTDVTVVGAGLENLLSAVGAKVALDPVSVSFGAVPSGSGQTATRTVTVSNLTGSALTAAASITGTTGSGVSYSVPSSFTLPAGGSTTVTVTMAGTKGATAGAHQAILRLSAGGTEVAHAALFTWMK